MPVSYNDIARSVCVPPIQNILYGCDDGSVRVVRIKKSKGFEITHQFKAHTDWVRGVCVTPDGKHVVSCSDDRTISRELVFRMVNCFV